MAKSVGGLVTELALRVHDTASASITRAQARRALAYGVGFAAVAFKDTLESFTLTTERQRSIYALSETSERILRVVRVEESGRDIPFSEAGVKGLTMSPNWFRDLADRFESFATIGKRLLILYPAIDRAVSVTLYCKAFPALVTADTQTVGIEDDLVPFALDVAETLLVCVRERRVDRVQAMVANIQSKLGVPTQV